jgi:methylenetetrahydrofolate dehydrogenase (NADP+) / methenyltetrahydrofolate cyclohydrolase
MGAIILNGKAAAVAIETQIALRARGANPKLTTILVVEDQASVTYVRMKANACRRVGIEPERFALSGSATTEVVFGVIDQCNAVPDMCDILLQPFRPGLMSEPVLTQSS